MIRLNLLPDIKRQYLRARRAEARVISLSILISIIAVGAVVLVALWVYAIQNIHKSSLTKSIAENSQKVHDIKDIEKYVTVQSQLANISGLHEKKTILSRVFDITSRLNPKAPNNVRISHLDIDTVGTLITLEGETDSFTGLETFRDTLKNATLRYKADAQSEEQKLPLFQAGGVTILSQGIGKTKTTNKTVIVFKLSALYAPEAFARDSGSLIIDVPTKDTTQSKQDSPNVFAPSQAVQGGNQ